MNSGVSEHLRRNVYGLVAIFIALGGSAVAANVAKNSVTSKSIRNGEVKQKDIAVGAVDASKVQANSLTGEQIDEASLRMPAHAPSGAAGGDLAGTYPKPQIAANALTGAEVIDATLTSADIADTNSLTTAEIDESGLVFSPGGQITGSLGQALLAPNSVGPAEIADNTVGPTEIADNAIGPSEIADNTVGPTEIADNAVGPTEIADNAVAGLAVADRSLTLADISSANLAAGNTTNSGTVLDGRCSTITRPLSGAQVGDLVLVVPRSSDDGLFMPPVRVTTNDEFTLTMCNFSGGPIINPSANVDVFALRP
jgi:hypothetical protein